jgi:hypothetical protein
MEFSLSLSDTSFKAAVPSDCVMDLPTSYALLALFWQVVNACERHWGLWASLDARMWLIKTLYWLPCLASCCCGTLGVRIGLG